MSRAQEFGHPVGLIMVDIDDFKSVNDSQGHQAGDKVLRQLAPVLNAVAGQENAYRYGGDEFAVLLPETDHEKTLGIAERLRRTVQGKVGSEGIRVSLGVASSPDWAATMDELIYGADVAMYWAKSEGKNRVGDWAKLVQRRNDGVLPWYAADRAVHAPDVVNALGAALSAKDPATSAHTGRCSWWAGKLADELGLSEQDQSIVRLASLLHDVGKLAVPDEVLFKPGPLNEDEWVQMRKHSTAALNIFGQIRSLTAVTPSVVHHHEHFDGSGYPDGLAGEEIPVASRILLVTDAFDAMTNDRPYRKAMPVKAAVEELERNSGGQFDPIAVEAFLRILTRDGAQPLRSGRSASGEMAARIIEENEGLDITHLLSEVKSPTLVVHRRDDRVVPVELGREMASLIPGARLATLEGDIHPPYWGDTRKILEVIAEFLDDELPYNETGTAQGAFRTVLFTDVEGSTAITERLGDAKAREVLREHERIVREALKAHGGSEVKTMGDRTPGLLVGYADKSYRTIDGAAANRFRARQRDRGYRYRGREPASQC